MSVSNQDEKTDNNDDGLQDLGIPVPIQTYLWGQLAPFIRPKLGKLHEAACMVNMINMISYYQLLLAISMQNVKSSIKFCKILYIHQSIFIKQYEPSYSLKIIITNTYTIA